MPRIGLRDLYYAKEISDTVAGASYEVPKKIADLMSANIQPQTTSGNVPADDAIALTITQINSIQVTIGVKDLPRDVEADLLGRTVDENGAIGVNTSDKPSNIAIGFRSKGADGGYVYYWFYKGTFAPYDENLQSQGNNVNIVTPSIVGTFLRRDFDDQFFWKINDKDDGVNQTVITNWFNSVYGSGAPVAATGVTEEPSTASISVGGILQLTTVVLPINATNKAVTYTTSDPTIATVGETGAVMGVAAGTATITAHTVDGSFTDTCAVTVA